MTSQKLGDRAALYGAPVVFLALVILTIWWVTRVDRKVDPLVELHAGRVVIGTPLQAVENQLGAPKAEWTSTAGTTVVRYERTSWIDSTKAVMIEDAFLEFDSDGRLAEIRYETHEPKPTPGT